MLHLLDPPPSRPPSCLLSPRILWFPPPPSRDAPTAWLRLPPLSLHMPHVSVIPLLPVIDALLIAGSRLLLPSHSYHAHPFSFLILIYPVPLILCVRVFCRACTIVRVVEPPPSSFIPPFSHRFPFPFLLVLLSFARTDRNVPFIPSPPLTIPR